MSAGMRNRVVPGQRRLVLPGRGVAPSGLPFTEEFSGYADGLFQDVVPVDRWSAVYYAEEEPVIGTWRIEAGQLRVDYQEESWIFAYRPDIDYPGNQEVEAVFGGDPAENDLNYCGGVRLKDIRPEGSTIRGYAAVASVASDLYIVRLDGSAESESSSGATIIAALSDHGIVPGDTVALRAVGTTISVAVDGVVVLSVVDSTFGDGVAGLCFEARFGRRSGAAYIDQVSVREAAE